MFDYALRASIGYWECCGTRVIPQGLKPVSLAVYETRGLSLGVHRSKAGLRWSRVKQIPCGNDNKNNYYRSLLDDKQRGKSKSLRRLMRGHAHSGPVGGSGLCVWWGVVGVG
jgi:hypothetical protein